MTVLATDAQRLKAATRALNRAVGGVECAAEISGKSKTLHGNFQSVNHPASFMSVADVAALEAVAHGTAGFPQVTRLLCQMAGGVFLPLPEGDVEGDDLPGAMLRLSCEIGAVAGEIRDAMEDGHCDAHEAAAVLAKLDALNRASGAMRQMLRAIMTADGGGGADDTGGDDSHGR